MKLSLPLVAVLVALSLNPSAPAAAAEKDVLEKSIDLKVTEAESGNVFKTFAQILDAELTVDPSLAGRKLTLQVENVRVRTALAAACESLGCDWTYVEGKPAKLLFKPSPSRTAKSPEEGKRPGLDDQIDIKVTQASVADVLRTAAQILSVELSLDPKVAGQIDLNLNDVPVRSVLTQICTKVGCNWSLIEGDKPVLRVTSTR